MNLLSLTLCAIGPYADEYTIDFAALGTSGVFLLEGPTGSGKSTIIDAIVFALYGGLAGSSSSDDRLHSHHAPPTVEPFVELVFENSAGIHRIRRTPAWDRPKSRGTGTTRVNQSVTLLRLATPDSTEGEALSSRAQEVGIEIRRIIGLTKEQFLQTIVLPQGEFARFLGASGEDRRLVLQSLFGTEIYDRTTDELVARRRAAHASVAQAEAAVGEALAGLRGAAGDDELEADEARAAVAEFAEAARVATASRDEARARRDATEAARVAQVRLVEALARRTALLERQQAVESAADEVAQLRSRLERGRRAATVKAPAAASAAAANALEQARVVHDLAESEHPALSRLSPDELDARRDVVVAEVERLQALAAVEEGLVERRAELSRATVAFDEACVRLEGDEAALVERGAARAELAAAVEVDAEAARRLDAARAALRDATSKLEAVRRLADLRAAEAEASAALGEAAVHARAAVESEAALRRRRITGMAGELALALVDGEPCAVCGATSHPVPAPLVDDHPTADDVDRAEAHRAAAEGLLREAGDRASALAGRVADAAASVGETAEPDAAAQVDTARSAVETAERAGVAHERRVAEVRAFEAETERTALAVQRSRESQAAESARIEGLERAIAESAAAVAEALGALDEGAVTDIAGLVAESHRERHGLTMMIDARRAFDRATDDFRARASELDEAVESAGFESASAAVEAQLDAAERRTLETALSEQDREAAVVAAGLASPEVAELTGDEPVDVESAILAASDAASIAAERADAAAVATDRAERSARALVAFDRALRAEEEVAVETRAVVRMADVAAAAGPENRTGVTLGTYVLLRRFDDVVAAANARLGVMSSGRYQLEVSDSRETSSRARKTGLALAIRDNATDTTRDPKSFSGGETFYASLSLALGLADVVQAEAGGIDLGTLFVDEGFGTLDPETLDSVMSELGRLSAGGRVVGIVSHVDELKQRIADRIEVRRRPDGSSVLASTVGVRAAPSAVRTSFEG